MVKLLSVVGCDLCVETIEKNTQLEINVNVSALL